METKPATCTIEAPCKINLHLAIGERRPDGFHELESLFAPLDFHDTLRFECGGKDGESSLEMIREGPVEDIPNERNLVLKAVSLFREKTGFKSGLCIRLQKRVPSGAGLGGGSSDAASSLLALNALAGDALPRDELRKMAAVLGSDVPFFLGGTDFICPSEICLPAAFVGGRGELVKPVKTPQELWVLLAKPDFSSDTAMAFRLLDQAREGDRSPGDRFYLSPKVKLPADILTSALEREPETWPFYNDFLPVFLTSGSRQNADQYQTMLANLKKAGASFVGLSGAGSCCFGIFRARETAEQAEREIKTYGNFVKLTFFLAQKTIQVLEY